MTFTTTSNRGFTNPKVGSRRIRTWIFERRGRRLVARRETTEGFITLRVRRSGSVYRVGWRTRGPCRRGDGTLRYSETVTFAVSDTEIVGGRELASRVTGRLIGRSPKGDCGGGPGGRATDRLTDRLTGRRTDLPREPVAAFSVEPSMLSAASPATATAYFSDESTDDGEVVARQWDFGDPASGAANSGTGPYPTHTYTAAGSYRVTLRVTDDVGLTDTAAAVVTVAP
jgi:PKD domain